MSAPHLLPQDEHNARLLSHVHPEGRPQPIPKDRYHLVVIGGGPAGLVAAFGAAGLGARVALVEKGLLGGDCLNVGCVPSKALLASAHAAHAARSGQAFGVRVDGEVRVDFGAVMERMRRLRADIAPHDSVARLHGAGIDVFLGAGRFTARDEVSVGDLRLKFSRAVIATGARASRPPIPGLDEVGALDNERLFELTELPSRLLVLGAGPIGVEMAQAFARFGSEVTVVDMADRLLPREDPQAGAVLADTLAADGVRLRLGARIVRFERAGARRVVVIEREGVEERLEGDQILLALGRTPNVESLELAAAGVEQHGRGVVVDDFLRTTNPTVYAIGDVASPLQFTHAADAAARIAVQNALFLPTARMSRLVVPWATYTDPEVAHVGPTVDQLQGRQDLQTFSFDYGATDRGVTEGVQAGFARVHADAKGVIVAATLVGPGAGELINEVTLAMTHGIGLGGLSKTIHAYPTHAEVLKRLGDAYNRTRLTPTVARVMKTWVDLRHG